MNTPQILRVHESPIPYNPHARYKSLVMWAWCWDWDGKKMIKVLYQLRFERFRGTKAINELPYYPLSFHESEAELRSESLRRSLQFIKATAKCPPGSSQMFRYDGNAYADRRKILARDDAKGRMVRGEWVSVPPNSADLSYRTTKTKNC